MENLQVCVLAAGLGSRLKIDHPKALAQLAGKSFIDHLIGSIRSAFFDAKISVVIGHKGEEIQRELASYPLSFVWQNERLGTGHAVKCFLDQARQAEGLDFSTLLVLYCDAPLLSVKTLQEFYDFHKKQSAKISLIATKARNPEGLGRVLVEDGDCAAKVVEEKDLKEEQKSLEWINAGFYLFEKDVLVENIEKIENKNVQKEYLITDLLDILHEKHQKVLCWKREDGLEFHSANDFVQLARLEKELQIYLNREWMKKGVQIVDPENTYIYEEVTLGRNCLVYPHVVIKGSTEIKDNVVIEEGTIIKNCTIEAGSYIFGNSYLENSYVAENSQIGPMAMLCSNNRAHNEARRAVNYLS